VRIVLLKRLLFGALLALLLLPAIQAKTHFYADGELAGAFTQTAHPDFTWAELRNNTYQPALERYIEDRIGFRTTVIRLRNQLSFSLFRVARLSDVVVGEHEVLFQPGAIAAYAGHNLLDKDEIRLRVRRLRIVQQELAKRGIQLLFVLAPNKARFQPEYLPAHLLPAPGTITNYDLLTQAMRADSVALLDMVPVFAHWKTTKPYPLFPRAGTHWSGYGATLAADTLLRHLESLGHMRFPEVRTVGEPRIISSSDSLPGTDNDLGWPLNLLWQREATPLAYRRLSFLPPKTGETRPSALFIGDSFTWGLMLFSPYMQREFSDNTRFWYYNNSVYLPDSTYHETGEKVANLNLKQQLEAQKFVVLMFTEYNLAESEFGFTEQAYHLYHPLTPADQTAIDQLAQQLTREASWEEQAKDGDGFQQRIRIKAQSQYERQMLLK
jgi:hypothetical protein